MCIIIYNNRKNTLSRQTLYNAYINNPDGCGLMYAAGNRITIYKELTDFNLFFDYYLSVKKQFPKSDVVLHFRIKTHGKVNTANIHPFIINDNLAFCHNGIINISMPPNCLHSDTIQFNEVILKALPKNFIYNPAIVELIKSYIGYSKLCFLDSAGEVTIINDNLGIWDGLNWFSNNSYKYNKQKLDKGFFSLKPKKNKRKAQVFDFDKIVYCEKCGIELVYPEEYQSGYCDRCNVRYYSQLKTCEDLPF